MHEHSNIPEDRHNHTNIYLDAKNLCFKLILVGESHLCKQPLVKTAINLFGGCRVAYAIAVGGKCGYLQQNLALNSHLQANMRI
jgi:hypothetical protein